MRRGFRSKNFLVQILAKTCLQRLTFDELEGSRAVLSSFSAEKQRGFEIHLLHRMGERIKVGELALRLNPNFSLAQGYYGLTLSYCGRWQEAALAASRALRLSPRDPLLAIYNGIAAYAQFVGRNYDEAMQLARQAVRQRADFVGGHRVLTSAAGMAGLTEVATAALRELRRAQPNISLAWIAREMPIKLEAERQHYLEGFHRAGLD